MKKINKMKDIQLKWLMMILKMIPAMSSIWNHWCMQKLGDGQRETSCKPDKVLIKKCFQKVFQQFVKISIPYLRQSMS